MIEQPTADEVDDAVDRWHEGAGMNMELHEYLGWSEREYSDWVSDPSKRVPLKVWPTT